MARSVQEQEKVRPSASSVEEVHSVQLNAKMLVSSRLVVQLMVGAGCAWDAILL